MRMQARTVSGDVVFPPHPTVEETLYQLAATASAVCPAAKLLTAVPDSGMKPCTIGSSAQANEYISTLAPPAD